MKKILFTLLIFILTGCQFCSVRVMPGTVRLTADNQVCLSISPHDFDKDSRFAVIGWFIYRDEGGRMIQDSGYDRNKQIAISPGECIYAKFNLIPGAYYEFYFTSGGENEPVDIGGPLKWYGSFTLSQDANGQFHLTDKKGAR
ncbi:hypothetical protein DSG52_00365 [Salmonella enterica subsp. enterica]|nr:hypothetical protein [Salmonella enterica]ECI4866237.1 hypothetical protein [Salmonella enterica subsp. enterica]